MKRLFLLMIACFCYFNAYSAYLRNIPVTVNQPDGTVLHCFASGDEFFNYLHDANGFTIMQHPQTGYYVYAEKRDGELVATNYIAGVHDPASKGLEPYALISPEEWRARRQAREVPYDPPQNRNGNSNHGTLNNIAIFIRFADDDEFTNSFSSVNSMCNDVSENAISMRSYFRVASYGALDISTTFYPGHNGETIISYQDDHPRSYFQPYNQNTNPNGYQGGDDGTERTLREFGLLERAVNYINIHYPIPTDLVIDHDNDGYVDNVCFIVKGDVGAWNSLLWPHQWALQDRTVCINRKKVWTFNFQLENVNTSTYCHEMNHSLGAPDLYHYTNGTNLHPVGRWDLMHDNAMPPQHCGAYMKMKYGHWVDEIPEIIQAGTYTLNPISSATPTNVAYKIQSNDPNQFYVLEYRDNTSLFETALSGSGLLVYRIDTRFNGNEMYDPSQSKYDEVYIFRPDGTLSENGNLSTAYFNANVGIGRTEFSSYTNPYPFFSDGTIDNNFRIYDITTADGTISFKYGTSPNCAPPTHLVASVVDNNVLLSWTAANNAQSYNIYRNGSFIGNTSETMYSDNNITGLYSYFLRSVDSNGLQSTASETVTVTIVPEGSIVIGDGGSTTNDNLPSRSNYKYSLTQQIYTVAELGEAGLITCIAFYNGGTDETRTYDFYMKATTKNCFSGTMDWETVSTLDKVYSGSVTMLAGTWTTITFDTPYAYDGTSNLVLVVDDNTRSKTPSSHLSCGVFDATSQAIYVHSDLTNYNPSSPSSYGGTVLSVKNQLLIMKEPLLSHVFNVTVDASPSQGGSVTDGGGYSYGDTCTVMATPADGYYFLNWTRNGEVVSNAAEYTFIVTNDMELVAHFYKGQDGFLVGDGIDHVDKYLPSYSLCKYSLTQQIYTSNELGAAGSITGIAFYNRDPTNTRTYDIYMKATTKSRFSGNTDWEAVSVSEKVYSGNVTMTKGIWTTITFDTPFTYDGTSNLVLVVDDNTGDISSARMMCRIFDADGTQTIYAISDDINYNPSSPSSYPGKMLWTKNQLLIMKEPLSSLNVTVIASPSQGGSVTGGGEYGNGQTCTVTATENVGYTFINWTKDGAVVSTSPTYSFTVTESANLTANFQLNSYEVNVTADPTSGGTVTGSGTYHHFETCTVTATPAEGYQFQNWTRDGEVVSDAADYTFTITSDIDLVAHFAEESDSFMVGDGGTSTNQYLPSSSYYKYALTQQIYTSDELGPAGSITGIAFYNGGAAKTRTYDIYMKHTTKSRFSSNTNWEAVSASDKVYSGSVTMAAGTWTTITFDTPFTYDGISNLVLVVDDNTGSYTSSPQMSCRVFDAPIANQAIYICSRTRNYNPSSPASYSGKRLSVKNQLLIMKEPLSINVFDVTVVASPSQGGSVTGGGEYGYGETCAVTATETEGYTFINWTKDGAVVSTSPTYSFTVTESANLTANFQLNSYEVNVTADPTSGGTVTGSGTYHHFETCTMTATPVEGYQFQNWTRDGEVVSDAADYTFTVTSDIDLVAHFAEESDSFMVGDGGTSTNQYLPSSSYYKYALTQQIYTSDELGPAGSITGIAFYNGGAAKARTYDIYMKHTTKSRFSSNTNWEAVSASDKVYSGSVTMSAGTWTTITFDTPFTYDGISNLVLVVDDNTGSYTSLPHMKCRVFNADGTQALYVYSRTTNYNPGSPASYSGTRLSVKNQLLIMKEPLSINVFNVTVVASPSQGGSVTGGGEYGNGQTCTVTATENVGYTFINWTKDGAVVSTSPTYSFTVTESANLTANFQLNSYEVNVTAAPVSGGIVTGSGTYHYFETCTVTATESGNYTFINWTKDGVVVSTSSTYSFTVTESANLTANFQLNSYDSYEVNVTAAPASGGTVTGSGTYHHFETCTVTATPAEGYQFQNWTRDGEVVSNAADYTFTVTSDMSLVAHFSEEPDGFLVGDGGTSTDDYLPSYSYYNYALTQQIYTSGELGPAGSITGIAFYNDGAAKTRTYDIYMKHTTKYCFSSTTDWEVVSASDKVYSGSVAMSAGTWTTITFDTPFAYYGTSNLVLVVDDNTGSYTSSPNMSCRVFDAPDANQAIYVYADLVDYNPSSPASYNGTRLSVKNQLFIMKEPLLINVFDVTVTASPSQGGSVTGGGEYGNGQTCTVTATENVGYTFISWTKNSAVVSTSPTYSFTVTESANLTANFQLNSYDSYEVNVTAAPTSGGIVTGSGTYHYFETCTVTATESGNYTFLNWTKDGVVVSTSPTYSFTVTESANLTANFQLNSYEVNVNAVPASGGTVTGSGSYHHFETCTVTATPTEGYQFQNWTRDGEVVSNAADYTFTVTSDMSLVAHFSEEPDGFLVGDGGTSTNQYLPSYSYYKYALTQQIYTADELGSAASITGIAFYNGGAAKTRTYDIYMKQTTKSRFSGTKDWEAVSASDKVYSGSVVMAAGTWTTITFDIPFAYYGTSNLVLVVDDNTGSYTSSPHMGCRVFNADGTQAIYAYSHSTNYNPSSPASYSGTRLSVKNQLLIMKEPLSIDVFNVTVVASPSQGGSVTGGGEYGYGETCTVTATENVGYTFISWTKNSAVVSTSPTYSFTVTESANLTANFQLNSYDSYEVNVTAAPASGGTVTGSGSYHHFETCTVTATPAEGYQFQNWTRDGEVVSDAADYTFTVTSDMSLVAHFYKGQDSFLVGDGGTSTDDYLPSYSYYSYALTQQIYTSGELGPAGSITGIAFYNDGAAKTRTYDIYMKHTTKYCFSSTTDWEAVSASDKVYSGSVTMSAGTWTTITFDTPFAYYGTSNLVLVVDDNTGSYTSSPNMSCRVFDAPEANQAIYVYADFVDYNPCNPASYIGTRLSVKNQLQIVMNSHRTDDFNSTIVSNDIVNGNINTEVVTEDSFTFYNNGNWIIINEDEATLQLIDANGRILCSESISGNVTKHFDVATGIYILRLVSGTEVKAQKIVVQ